MPFPCRLLPALGLLLLAAGWPALLQAHAMLHEVAEGESVVVRFSFPGGDQPWFEPYEVRAPGMDTVFQSGRVNARGEVSFRPDRAGEWRVRVFTEDGHGAVVTVDVAEAGRIAAVHSHHAHAHDYAWRVAAALGYLLLFFSLLIIWRHRRARAGPG
jgi:nickel transport protein